MFCVKLWYVAFLYFIKVTAIVSCLLCRLYGFITVFERLQSAELTNLMAVIRLMIIRITFMVVFIASVLVRKTSLFKSDDKSDENSSDRDSESDECWENIIGNELYKLYMFQVLLSIGFNTVIFEYLVTIVAKTFEYVKPHPQRIIKNPSPEFQNPKVHMKIPSISATQLLYRSISLYCFTEISEPKVGPKLWTTSLYDI